MPLNGIESHYWWVGEFSNGQHFIACLLTLRIFWDFQNPMRKNKFFNPVDRKYFWILNVKFSFFFSAKLYHPTIWTRTLLFPLYSLKRIDHTIHSSDWIDIYIDENEKKGSFYYCCIYVWSSVYPCLNLWLHSQGPCICCVNAKSWFLYVTVAKILHISSDILCSFLFLKSF